MEPMFSNGMCRCCASEGTYKDLSSKYRWMGVDEVYADMLRECFDVTLVTPEDSTEGGICEVCITQLRNAANFKKQVLNTEEQFKRVLQNKPYKSDIVKVEVSPPDDELRLTDEDNNLSNDDFSSTEYEVPIKTESSEEGGKSRKRSAKAGPSRSKHAKLEGETSSKQRRGKRQPLVEEKLTLNKRINFSSIISIRPSKKLKNQPSDKAAQKQRRLTELDLHFDNIKTVIRCSNATPIRCKVGDRYACGYCLDQYTDPRELKRHTLAKHSDCDDKLECLNIRSLSKYNVHLDITSLKCTNCDTSIPSLQALIEHLKAVHEEPYHSHIRNLMVPYKFEGLGLVCALCPRQFDSYERLQAHMAEHCRNYVCEFCDKPFLARQGMLDHKKDVHHV